MFALLKLLLSGRPAPVRSRSTRCRSAALRLEALEERWVPSVTYQGGGVLPNVEAQAVYLGSDWYNNKTYYQQTGYLEGSLKSLVSGSYMDMLNQAGYGVGRGSASQGIVDLMNINKSYYLTDSTIRSELEADIHSGALQTPDANRLYVVYVEPNVAIMNDHGGNATSITNFLGYHGAFAGTDRYGHGVDIHYVVVAYPGGSVGNASSSLSPLNGMTVVTSHEVAESVTDPNVNYKQLGWYDSQLNGEVGDLAAGQYVTLNGYTVQRIVDQHDQAMTPAGATAASQVNFVLLNGGALWQETSSGWTYLSSGIASISDQSIDDNGQAMIDVVTTGGFAYEYHEGSGWVYLTGGVSSAKAGQGVSYVLQCNGNLWEYKDGNPYQSSSWRYLDGSVTQIDAGTDRYGVNMVDVIFSWGATYEDSDSTGWHYLGSGITSVSAGQHGISDLLYSSGAAYWYNEATNGYAFLASGVKQVTAGTDQNGNYMIDLVFSNGVLDEYRVGTGWSYLSSGVQSVSKGHAGVEDVVFSLGFEDVHTIAGWSYVTGNVHASA